MSNHTIYKILAVDDNIGDVLDYGDAMRGSFIFETADTPARMWSKLVQDAAKPASPKTADDEKYDLLLLDLVLDPKKPNHLIGLDLLPEITIKYPQLPIIVVTNDRSWDTGNDALRRGAKDFLRKYEYNTEGWMQKFRLIIENSKNQQEVVKSRKKKEYEQDPKHPFIGVSDKIEKIRKKLKELGEDSNVKVLILGETGVGKGVAARFMHYNMETRRKKRFEQIDISTISKDIIQGELFGAKKGAYTGADRDKTGLLELANGGTVFLDEIGELTPENQKALLQFLQHGRIRPVGGEQEIELDVHLISATNKDLEEEVEEGNFREDLYYRINDEMILIPPIRQRQDDIVPLLLHFLGIPDEKTLRSVFDQDLFQWLHDFSWPGNIRQLEKVASALKRNRKDAPLYTIDFLPDNLLNVKEGKKSVAAPQQQRMILNTIETRDLGNLERELAQLELQYIEEALRRTYGRKEEAAQILALGTGDNIYTRIKKYKLKFPDLLRGCPHIIRYYFKGQPPE